MLFCIRLPNFVHPLWKYDVISMAAATAKYYFRFRICWCHCLQKVIVYQQTKFRRDISIGGWDITTFDFEIQTSYFRFRSRPVRRNLHIILYQAIEFRPNRSTRGGNMMSYLFLKMAAATAKYYFRFLFVDVTVFRRSKSISKPNFVQISQLAAEI